MKFSKITLFVSLFVAVLVAFSSLISKQIFGDKIFDDVFGESLSLLPVQRAGRVMPLSSASADVLKASLGKITAKLSGVHVSSTKWIWLLNADSEKMGDIALLRTDNRELQKLLKAQGRYVSYNSVVEKYDTIYDSAISDEVSAYSKACVQLLNGATSYGVSVNAFCVKYPDVKTSVEFIENWRSAVSDAEQELKDSASKKLAPNEEKLVVASAYLNFLRSLSTFETQNNDVILKVVSVGGSFNTPVQVLLDRNASAQAKNDVLSLASLADSIAKNDEKTSQKILARLFESLRKRGDVDFVRIRIENIFNALNPFFTGLILYALAFVAYSLSGLKWRGLALSGTLFLIVGVVLHILAIIARVYIQMRPPVTNFYSSVVFTGAVAALFGVGMYLKKESLLMAISASFIGVLSLLVAVNLPYSGDTMGMMRAVLNSNFWLSAHVMTIMIGYCGLFLAGFLASFRLIANAFSKGNFGIETTKTANAIYMLLCWCLLFTFMGTMLGGVWADMSWGRFWGWDPKENGALMIVLWTAGAIHCKVLRVCNDRIFLVLTALGNIVVAWAWFGVNLLGVGLHSYGFIDGGWLWFFIFIILQILVAPFGFLVYKDDNIILKK